MNQGALANLILGGAIALLPLYTRVGEVDLNRTAKDNLFLVIVIALMAILPNKARALPKSLWALFVYVIGAVVINQWNPAVVMVMMQSFYIVAGIAFFAAYYERHDKESLHLVLNGMAIGAIIQSIFGITDYLNIDLYEAIIRPFTADFVIVKVAVTQEITGSFGHSNLLGSYLALTLPAFFRPRWAWLIPLPVLVVIISKSFMGMGACLAAGLYYLNARYGIFDRLWIYVASAWGMFTLFYVGINGADSQRFDAWRTIFSWVDLKHFLVGMGPGWFASMRLMLSDGVMAQEHSGFIAAFNVLGILAFLIPIPVIFKFMLKRDHDEIFTASLFAAFCSSFGHFTLHQSTVAIIIIAVAAVCLSQEGEDELDLER